MRIFRETCRNRARAGLLCLLVTFWAGNAGAADLPSSKPAAQTPWRVALALFYKVGETMLPDAESRGFTLGDARSMAAAASADALSATLPSLVQSALAPLPDRETASGKMMTSTAFAEFSDAAAKGKTAAPFVDLRVGETLAGDAESPKAQADAPAAKSAWEGLVCGFFALAGETIDCRVLLFDAGSTAASRVLSWRGEISGLDGFAGTLLPAIASWVAGKDLGIVDIMPQPENGAPLSLALESDDGRGYLKGSRLYAVAEGAFRLHAGRAGFASRSIEVSGAAPGSYRKVGVALEPAAAAIPATSLTDAGSLLNWKESDAFRRSETRYRSALGRFVASVPLTAIALGVFFSYGEAYARGAASDAVYYASGAGAAAAAGLSLGFLIDSAIGLVNVLRASK